MAEVYQAHHDRHAGGSSNLPRQLVHGTMNPLTHHADGEEQRDGSAVALKVPITIELQPEGGYAVRIPALPELITEGASLDEATAQVPDAVTGVLELYEDLGKPLPAGMMQDSGMISYDALIPTE